MSSRPHRQPQAQAARGTPDFRIPGTPRRYLGILAPVREENFLFEPLGGGRVTQILHGIFFF